MADDYGTGVSRVLDPQNSQLTQVVWQKGKPPLDSELNYIQQLAQESGRSGILRDAPSGWLGNGINDPEAFITNPTWSNWFRFGNQKGGEEASIQWAAVNGWLIPVTGTQTGTPPGSPDDAATWNRVTLGPPPSNSGDSRIDFVFLEVWRALLPTNPSATNKPSSSAIYKYGNVEGGMSFLPDDMIDPEIGFETTKRVQVQYRIRVVTGLVGLQSFPDGFDPANVKARGTATTDTSFVFTNMREELGDPGLWRAGDGTPNSLGTVDGYSYAIPLAAVFRRNSVAWDGDPGQNLNGGFNRNPTAVDRTGWKTFSTVPTLSAGMNASQLTLTLTSATNIPLPASPSTPVLIQVGDEVMSYTSITGTTVTLASRGQLSTKAVTHAAGETIRVVSGRPDGLYSDQVAKTDVLDLRHVVSPGGFDYQSMLQSNLDKALRGTLASTWKRSGGGPQSAAAIFYQDKVSASPPALGVSKLDSPDGIREIWSSASVLQPVTFIAKVPTGNTSSEDVTTTWGLSLTAECDNSTGVSTTEFNNNAVITIPISQFKTTVPGSDQDQVTFPVLANSSATPWVRIRVSGTDTDLDPDTDFTVTPPTGPDDDLLITLTTGGTIEAPLHMTIHVQYGPSRGLSRRPDTVHSVAYLNAGSGTLLRQRGTSANNTPVSTEYAPLWSKFRSSRYLGRLPATAESYIDPGSQTVVLTPFRKIDLPAEPFKAIRNTTINGGDGPMPDSGLYGGTIDPLNLFSSELQLTSAGSTYIVLPRNLVPGHGALHVPIIHTDTADFVEGSHFGFYVAKSLPSGGAISNVVPNLGQRLTTFTTLNLNTEVTQTFNTSSTFSGLPMAGIRHFTDTSGDGRQGLQFCPFYGIAKLFAVYEALDYKANGSNYNTNRTFSAANSANLLKQDVEGPTFFIEQDVNGDATFILNAAAITDYDPGTAYVVEADIFGFDRGFFDISSDARVVLTRERPDALDAVSDPDVNLDNVAVVFPAPPQASEGIAINFSRTAYQGDIYLSQGGGQDVPQTVGPLTSLEASTVGYTELDQENLSRPNQKALEILASVGFMTTLGTGRISGDFNSSEVLNFRYPGYEDSSAYPPTLSGADRPALQAGVSNPTLVAQDGLVSLGTDFSGCTTRLPLGALFRDHDFRGNSFPTSVLGFEWKYPSGGVSGTVTAPQLGALPVNTVDQSGHTTTIVHVDGESASGNWANLDNFRTTRGGSAFVASGQRPGGEISAHFGPQAANANYNSTLVGVAYLVRNAPTSIGATEVNAGSELQMVISTMAVRAHDTNLTPLFLQVGTNGTGEGFGAVDVYRCEGRPLESDGVRVNINPSDVLLSPKISFKPRLGE